MKHPWTLWPFFIALLLFCVPSGVSAADAVTPPSQDGCLTSFFTNSLHYTGEGMRRWYEEDGGFMEITKIPYDQLDCKSCHVKSCDECHAKRKRAKFVFSPKKANDINTCLKCHSREGLTYRFDSKFVEPGPDGEKSQLDVHMAAGMVCADCHRRYDVHGDGRFRPSMRHPKGVRITCRKCHIEHAAEFPGYDPEIDSHMVHGDKLNCAACHVRNTMTCYNCHFDEFLKTNKRKGNFIPMKDWMLLINYEGQVTSGSAMTLVHQNQKFIAYVPYFTHSIMRSGRQCDECHASEAAVRLSRGETVKVVDYKDGRIENWKGVVPVVPEGLDWVFLNRTENGWKRVPNDTPPKVQYAAFGTPLTPEQLSMLAEAP